MAADGKQPALSRVASSKRIPIRPDLPPAVAETSPLSNRTATRLAGSAMFSPPAWAAITQSLQLSGRELQIVRGVFDGQKESTLAQALGISVHTIHSHFERLHFKLGISDRVQLLQRVMQEFLTLTAAPGNGLPPLCPSQFTGHCPLRR